MQYIFQQNEKTDKCWRQRGYTTAEVWWSTISSLSKREAFFSKTRHLFEDYFNIGHRHDPIHFCKNRWKVSFALKDLTHFWPGGRNRISTKQSVVMEPKTPEWGFPLKTGYDDTLTRWDGFLLYEDYFSLQPPPQATTHSPHTNTNARKLQKWQYRWTHKNASHQWEGKVTSSLLI